MLTFLEIDGSAKHITDLLIQSYRDFSAFFHDLFILEEYKNEVKGHVYVFF
jgi:antirestriction protein